MVTSDRLAEWHITCDWWCTFCWQPGCGTRSHTVRSYQSLLTMYVVDHESTAATELQVRPRNESTSARKLRLVCTALGRQELWQNRCFVDLFRGKCAPIVEMMNNVSAKAKLFLES